MKIATYNVNGVNGRLEILLRWLKEASPDVFCLQELKAPQEKFPIKAIEAAGYGAVWHGQKSWNGVAILAKSLEPQITRKGLPGGPHDATAVILKRSSPASSADISQTAIRIRARNLIISFVGLSVSTITLPSCSNSKSGHFGRDYNVMPTELDVYKPERWVDDALVRVEVRDEKLGEPGLDGRASHAASERTDIHLLGLLSKRLRSRCRTEARPLSFGSEAASRLAKAEVDKHVRGWEHTSDQVPVWTELADEPIQEEEETEMKSKDWRSDLPLRLEDFVDSFVVKGAKHEEVYDAIKAEIENLRASYQRDPDPADDDAEMVEEPANDWPAAD